MIALPKRGVVARSPEVARREAEADAGDVEVRVVVGERVRDVARR